MPILKELNPRLGGKPFGSKQPWKLETNYLFVLGFHILVVPVGDIGNSLRNYWISSILP